MASLMQELIATLRKEQEAYQKLLDAEAEVIRKGIHITDDAMVMETFGNLPVKLVEASYRNIKITTPEDLKIAEVFLKNN